MGKGKYVGANALKKYGLVALDTQDGNSTARTTIAQQAKNVGIFLFGEDGNQTPSRFNVSPKWLQSMFITAKMFGLQEKNSKDIEIKLTPWETADITEAIRDKLIKGEPLTDNEINSRPSEDLRNIVSQLDAQNSFLSNFYKDVQITENTYGQTLQPKEKPENNLKNLIIRSFKAFDFTDEQIEGFFNPSFMKDSKSLNKLTPESIEQFENELNDFMDKVEEVKAAKYKKLLEEAENQKDEDLAKDFEDARKSMSDSTQKGKDGLKTDDITDVLTNAIKANTEMQKRIQSPVYKKIPLLRLFFKEYRDQRNLLNDTQDVIDRLSGGTNIKAYLKENHSVEDIYGLISSVAENGIKQKAEKSNEKDLFNPEYKPVEKKEDNKVQAIKDDSVINPRTNLSLGDVQPPVTQQVTKENNGPSKDI